MVSVAVSSVQGDDQIAELLTLWESLNQTGRADLLAIARGLANL